MPAPTTEKQAGELRCSDGTFLTDTMRCSNGLVGLLAKEAARSIAMPPGDRASLKNRFVQAKQWQSLLAS